MAIRQRWWWLMGIFCTVLALFSPVLQADFLCWDDNINVTNNALLTKPWSIGLLGDFLNPVVAMRFKPLHWAVLRGLYMVDGLNPTVWHVFGWLLHGVVSAWLFLVLRRCLKISLPELGAGRATFCAAAGALLWALHPSRVEPVAWVTGSTYPMSGLLLVASFHAYLTAYESPHRRRHWLILSWLAAVAAYLTYPVSITYGLWLIAVDIGLLRCAPSGTWRNWLARPARRWCFKHVMFLGPAFLSILVTLWSRMFSVGHFTEAPSLQSVSLWDRVLMAAATLGKLGSKFLLPIDLSANQASFEIPPWQITAVWVAATSAGLTIAVALIYRKKHPTWFWLMLGYVGLCLPCLGFTEDPVWPVDRYSYLGDMILVGGVIWLLAKALTVMRWKSTASALMVGWVSISGIASWNYLPVWKNSGMFFNYTTQVPGATDNLGQYGHLYLLWGYYLISENRPEEAAEKLKNAGRIYLIMIEQAVKDRQYVRAIAVSKVIEMNLGLAPVLRRERAEWWLHLGNSQAAMQDLQLLQEREPNDPRTLALITQARAMQAGTIRPQ